MEAFYALLGIAAYILSGFLKSREIFDGAKALKTAVLGVLLIALNTALGLQVSQEELNALLSAGELAVLENMLKAVWRKVFSTL
ncbi:MAG: hypothetical protein QW470_06210 [Candidatus Caldarchaeum sp.]